MNRDAVFLDLWHKITDPELRAKLLYTYLQDLPPQCVPDEVLPLVHKPVYPPITIPREDVDRAVQAVAVELDRYRCMSKRDVSDILRRALSRYDEELVERRHAAPKQDVRGVRPRYDEELVELLSDVVARVLTESGRAAVVGGKLCLAAESGFEVVKEEPNALIVRFRCRDGKTRTYVISPLETEEEEEELQEEIEEL